LREAARRSNPVNKARILFYRIAAQNILLAMTGFGVWSDILTLTDFSLHFFLIF